MASNVEKSVGEKSVDDQLPARSSWIVTVAAFIAILLIPLLIIWTALEPVPRLPYGLQVELGVPEENLPALPRICSIVPKSDLQRERQLERCPPEALEQLNDLEAQPPNELE